MQFERCFPIRHLAVGDAFGTGVTKRWATAVVDGVLTCFKYHRIVSQTAESSRSLITSHSQDFHQAWDIFHRSILVFLKNLVDTPKSHGFPHFRPQIGGKSSFWSKTHKRMGASSCFWSTCPAFQPGFLMFSPGKVDIRIAEPMAPLMVSMWIAPSVEDLGMWHRLWNDHVGETQVPGILRFYLFWGCYIWYYMIMFNYVLCLMYCLTLYIFYVYTYTLYIHYNT